MDASNGIVKSWIRIAFINLMIVALLGTIMRYKIAYSLPFLDQKHVLHAHSHFAFSGWVTQALFILMVHYFSRLTGEDAFKKYRPLLWSNLITSYGMLLSFPFWGYNIVSIIFSTLSIFVSYVFAVVFWKDLNRVNDTSLSSYWFKTSLVFNVLSSVGAFSLAYMMANKLGHTEWYLSSIYYFLHFQYNGWFFFACMGLVTPALIKAGIDLHKQKMAFWLFAIACVPAFFLSVLWVKIPLFVYILVVLSSLAQVVAWVLLITSIYSSRKTLLKSIVPGARAIFLLAAIALSAKLLLQLGSTIPTLSHLAFGFKSIVIGYLHLVLLGVITMFILGYTRYAGMVFPGKATVLGTDIFIVGIILNEVLLMVQGIGAMSYVSIPYTNGLLLIVALTMLLGLIILNIGLREQQV